MTPTRTPAAADAELALEQFQDETLARLEAERAAVEAAVFAALEAIRAGSWDSHLKAVTGAIMIRRRKLREFPE